MSENLNLRMRDLVDNPSTRLPVCLCLDTSYSMEGEKIQELKKGVDYFFQAIKDDEIARDSVEVCIVIFNSEASVELDFAGIDRQQIPDLNVDGATSMGEGVHLALDALNRRKKEYSDMGVDYYQPWLVLMTDGCPTDNVETSISRLGKLINNKKCTIFPIAIGEDADIGILKKFACNKMPVLNVSSPQHFKEFFVWLSQSVSVASQSVPGDNVNLPTIPPELTISL